MIENPAAKLILSNGRIFLPVTGSIIVFALILRILVPFDLSIDVTKRLSKHHSKYKSPNYECDSWKRKQNSLGKRKV